MNQEKITELEQSIRRDYGNVAGIVVQKNGKTAYEGYFNGYTAERALHVFSVTKSVVNALVGIAMDKGYIQKRGPEGVGLFPGLHGETRRKNCAARHDSGHSDHDRAVQI